MKKYVIAGTGIRALVMFYSRVKEMYASVYELAGVYDINHGRAKYFINDADVPIFDDFEKMLDTVKPDKVIVTTVDAFHDEYIIKALKMGYDVITEKPMTTDATKCNAILEAEKETGHKVTVTFNYRYAPFMTKIKELVNNGTIGDVFSVHFEWLLDRNMDIQAHGTSYFRRWNARMKNSGGLLVHKSTHHFDLVNWWINQKPEEVFAFAKLNLYGRSGSEKYANGIKGVNCRNCEFADKCEFYYDLEGYEIGMYANNEHIDGYYKDGCVYADDIDIYDTMAVTVKYDKGALLTYSLNATTPYEGWRVSINGSKGRIEAYLPETGPYSKDDTRYIKFFDLNNKITEYRFEDFSAEGHNGGDAKILYDLFIGDREDLLGHCAGTSDGAYSIIVGVAANISIKENRPVAIKELLKI